MKTGSKMCILERSHGFSKIWAYVLVFDLTWPNFGPSLDLTEISILAKFQEDCIKTVPSDVYTYKIWPSDLNFLPLWPIGQGRI